MVGGIVDAYDVSDRQQLSGWEAQSPNIVASLENGEVEDANVKRVLGVVRAEQRSIEADIITVSKGPNKYEVPYMDATRQNLSEYERAVLVDGVSAARPVGEDYHDSLPVVTIIYGATAVYLQDLAAKLNEETVDPNLRGQLDLKGDVTERALEVQTMMDPSSVIRGKLADLHVRYRLATNKNLYADIVIDPWRSSRESFRDWQIFIRNGGGKTGINMNHPRTAKDVISLRDDLQKK